jgi:hypothetical protein
MKVACWDWRTPRCSRSNEVEGPSKRRFPPPSKTGAMMMLNFVPVPALIIMAQEFVPGAPATASGMVLGLGSALAGTGYIALGRVQEVVGLTTGILIGFSMVVPAALIALVVLLRGGGEAPVTAP